MIRHLLRNREKRMDLRRRQLARDLDESFQLAHDEFILLAVTKMNDMPVSVAPQSAESLLIEPLVKPPGCGLSAAFIKSLKHFARCWIVVVKHQLKNERHSPFRGGANRFHVRRELRCKLETVDALPCRIRNLRRKLCK